MFEFGLGLPEFFFLRPVEFIFGLNIWQFLLLLSFLLALIFELPY